MQVNQKQTTVELNAAYPETPARKIILSVRQFHQRNPAFSESAIRNLIFKSQSRYSTKGVIPGNGLVERGAVVRLGRRVLIDEAQFLVWVVSAGGGQ
jgi:hypothetical protein